MPITIGNTTVTFNDSTTQSSARVGPGIQVFTSGGTFTVPAGITAVKVTVFGGGGGGGTWGQILPTSLGGYGGAGIAIISGLTSGASITVTIGSGGNGANYTGSPSSVGTSGGTSSFGSYASATGGLAGLTSVQVASGVFTTTGIRVCGSPSGINAKGTNYNNSKLLNISIGGAHSGWSTNPGSSGELSGAGGGGMSGGGQGGSGTTAHQRGYAFGPGANGNTTTNNAGGAGGGSAGGTGGTAPGGGGGGTGGVIVEW